MVGEGVMDKKSGSVYTFTPIRVVDNLTVPLYAKTHVHSRLGEGTRCCEEIVQEDIVVIDNKSLASRSVHE